jgi:hypothetical protein
MPTDEQFQHNHESSSGENHIATHNDLHREVAETPKKVTGLFSLSGFLLNSPLAKSELSIPRDYVFDRYIELQP